MTKDRLRNVLVTAGNGDLGEAVAGVIRDAFPDVAIHATEIGSSWPAAFIFDSVTKVPHGDAPNYVDTLAQVVHQRHIDLIVPCSDVEIRHLANVVLDDICPLPLLMPNADLVIQFSDKLTTAQWLSKNSLPTPHTVMLTDASPADLPLIAKPRAGSGSTGIIKVTDAALLAGLQSQFAETYVAQSFLEGEDKEYTCALLRVKNELRVLILHRRLDAGRTVCATIVNESVISDMLTQLALSANLEGSLNIQLRLVDNKPQIFEINPRFSSTVKMRHMLGFKDLEWMIRSRYNAPLPEVFLKEGASVYRLSREILR
jgi:carbamoyl-phosphate synthase large subunit